MKSGRYRSCFSVLVVLAGNLMLAATLQAQTLSANAQNILSMAEQIYPTLFVNGTEIRQAQGYAYRFYSLTGIYVGFREGRVYVVGGPFGDSIRDQGAETTVISALETARTRIQARAALSEPLPTLPGNAVLSGMREVSCSQEGTLKSPSINASASISVTNSTAGQVRFYWLDFSGKRVEYARINAGASYTQGSFASHPWLIADAFDTCIGIFVADSSGSKTIRVNADQPGTSGDTNVDRVIRGIECLLDKGDTTNATAIRGIKNGYLQFKPILGAELAYAGYLSAGVDQLDKLGC
jgi:hypothetical protein